MQVMIVHRFVDVFLDYRSEQVWFDQMFSVAHRFEDVCLIHWIGRNSFSGRRCECALYSNGRSFTCTGLKSMRLFIVFCVKNLNSMNLLFGVAFL